MSLYLSVPDEGSLLPKNRDCTASNDFELFLMCCGVMCINITRSVVKSIRFSCVLCYVLCYVLCRVVVYCVLISPEALLNISGLVACCAMCCAMCCVVLCCGELISPEAL